MQVIDLYVHVSLILSICCRPGSVAPTPPPPLHRGHHQTKTLCCDWVCIMHSIIIVCPSIIFYKSIIGLNLYEMFSGCMHVLVQCDSHEVSPEKWAGLVVAQILRLVILYYFCFRL